MSAYTQEEREMFRVLAQVRKSRKLAAVLEQCKPVPTPEQILTSSDEWRRTIEGIASVSKSSDVTWSIVGVLLEPLDV